MTQPSHRTELREVLLGIGILFLCHFAVYAATTLFSLLAFALISIGISQLAYAIPLYRRFRREGRPAVAKGIVIGGIMTLFLQGGCFIYAMWIVFQGHG